MNGNRLSWKRKPSACGRGRGNQYAAADDGTGTPAGPWQTGALHYKDDSLFPDEAFRNYLDAIDSDKNGSVGREEAAAYFDKNGGCMDLIQADLTVFDFTGVEALAEWVTALRCKPTGDVPLQLDVSGLPLLEELVCSGCALTALDVSQNPALRILECTGNPLSTLDIAACPLLVDAVKNGTKQETAPELSDPDNTSPGQGEPTVVYVNGNAVLTAPSDTDLILEDAPAPDAEDVPAERSDAAGSGLCQWCGEAHNGFFGKIVGFFHSLRLFFHNLFGRK